MSKKILVIEDDSDIAVLVKTHLSDLGHTVDIADTGSGGLNQAREGSYALIVLDLMLPEMDGYEVCKKIREGDKRTPILMLTCKSDLLDKVLGLELGADDYLTKPFRVEELIARAKALLRRVEVMGEPVAQDDGARILEFGDLVVDKEKRKVVLSDKDISLTAKQFDLLAFLASNPGRPYTRQELLMYIWGYEGTSYEHTVDTHVNRLRAKIEPEPSKPRFILTVWGVGYRFVEAAELLEKKA